MAVAAARGGEATAFWHGLVVQAEVVYAVVLRETRTRFGAHKLGYLWAILEPVVIILTFFAMARLSGRAPPPGMDVFSFLTTGLVPYQLFASCMGRVAESINGNRALLYYPPVQPIDLAIARGLLECVTYAGIFIVLMAGHALYCQELRVDSLPLTLFGLALAALLGSAIGLVFCCLGQYSNAVDRIRGPLLRPLFWISGVFFTAEWVPESFRSVALKNPVLHVTELVRAGWFSSYGTEYASPLYVLTWIGIFGLGGLALERAVRRRIELT